MRPSSVSCLLSPVFCLLSSVFFAGCASTAGLDRFDQAVAAVEIRTPPSDSDLATRADLDTIIAIALARYPGLRESLERARAMGAMARAAGRLDDPMLRIGLDQQPVRGSGVNGAIGFEQALPWPGKLDLQRADAVGRAEAALEDRRARERDVVLAVKRVYYEYFRWTREREVREEHVKLIDSIGKLSEARYTAGKVSQQDVLKPQVERGMVQTDLFDIERMIATARVRLNALMDRAPDAPIGPPAAARTAVELDATALTARALESRPEIRAAEAHIRSARAASDLADKHRALPDFTLGVQYMQRPDDPDEVTFTAGVNLPWLSGRRSSEAQAARITVVAEEAAGAVARSTVTREVREALLRVQALDRTLDLIERELLARSKQSTEAAMSGYENALAGVVDVLDAERSQRDIKLAHIRALAERETAVAELERALGADLRRKP